MLLPFQLRRHRKIKNEWCRNGWLGGHSMLNVVVKKVGHMMTGKAYSRVNPGHFLSISSLLSILMVEFWRNLKQDKCKMLKNIFDSEYPSINQNHEISTKLFKWYENKKSELRNYLEPVNCNSAILSTYLLSRSLSELKK